MQKKILLSLLIASPTAMPALADINFGYGDWSTPQGVDGKVDGSYDKTEGHLTSSLNSGFSKYVVSLQPGKYKLTFTRVNNLAIAVSQNGVKIPAIATKGTPDPNYKDYPPMTVSFEVPVAGVVTIEATPEVPAPFGFYQGELSLAFDFVKAGGDLNTLMSQVVPEFTTIKNTEFPGAQALIDRRDGTKEDPESGLADLKALYNGVIATLINSEAKDDELMKIYTDWALYKTPSLLTDAINVLGQNVTVWNEEAVKLNTQIDNTNANKTTQAALQAEQKQLMDGIKALEQSIKTACDNQYKNLFDPNGDIATLNANIAALKANVEEYGKDINNAFADLATKVIEYPSKYAAFLETLNALNADWTGLQGNWNNFITIQNTIIPGLDSEYIEAKAAINALQGEYADGTVNAFETLKPGYLTAVENIYTPAKAAMPTPNADTTTEEVLKAYQDTLKDATEKMQAQVKDATTNVEAQNTYYADAQRTLKGLEMQLEPCYFEQMPENLKNEYNSLKSQLNNLKTTVNQAYANATLPVADFSETTADLGKAIQNLFEQVGPAAEINKLTIQLEDLDAYIKDLSVKLNDPKQGGAEGLVDLYGMFGNPDGTLDSIKKQIQGLTAETVAANKQGLLDSMKQAKSDADDLYNAYIKLIAADNSFATQWGDLVKFVNGRTELAADGTESTGDSAFKQSVLNDSNVCKTCVDFKERNDKFHEALLGLDDNKATRQEVYDAALALLKDLDTYNTPTLEAAEQAAAFAISSNNMSNLNRLKNKAEELLEDNDFLDSKGVRAELADITGQIAAIELTESTSIENLAKADADMVKLAKKLLTLNSNIAKYIANQAEYDRLLGLMTPTAQNAIDGLLARNAELSKDGAKDYFDNEISGENNPNSLQSRLDALEKSLAEKMLAYDPEKNTPMINEVDYRTNPTGDKITFDQAIETLNGDIEKMATTIESYNFVHNQQLADAESLSKKLDNAVAALEEKNKPGVADWYQPLKDILDTAKTDLFNYNVEVANDYNTGKTLDEQAALQKKYDAIDANINSVLKALGDAYDQAVIDNNNQIVSDLGWDAMRIAMNNEYVLAIENFNKYFYGLNNAGWREQLQEVTLDPRHRVIYEYSQKINDLIKTVNEYIAKCNTKPVTLLTKELFTEKAITPANNLITEMRDKVKALNTEAAKKAETYYATLHSEAETQINGCLDALKSAGIIKAQLDLKGYMSALQATGIDQLKDFAKAISFFGDAEGKYAVATNVLTSTQPLGLAMDKIADDLDKALVPVDLQQVAEAAWTTAYSKANKEVSDILNNLLDKNKNYADADDEIWEKSIADIEALQPEMSDLNDTVSGVTEGLINDYAGYIQQLQGYVNAATAARDEVKKSNDNNHNNTTRKAELLGYIPTLETGLKALVEYADSMAGGREFDADAILAKINALSADIESNASQLYKTGVYNNLLWQKKAIDNAINNGYGPNANSVAYDEMNYFVDSLLPMVKIAFNDAKAAFLGAAGTMSNLDKATGLETIEGTEPIDPDKKLSWNETIKKYEKEIGEMPANYLGNKFDKAKFQKQAQEVEEALSSLYAEMQQSWTSDEHDGSNPADNAVAALQNQYNEVAADIEEANAYLAGCNTPSFDKDTAAGFKTALENAADELAAQKTAWEKAGNRVVVMEPTYQQAMAEIAEEVAQKRADMQTAYEKALANDTAYAALNSELNNLKTQFGHVKELATEWYPGQYGLTLHFYHTQIEDAEAELNEPNGKVELTADSKLLNGDEIANDLSALELSLTKRQADDKRSSTNEALNDVVEALAGNVVPEAAEAINASLDQLRAEYDVNYDKQTGANDVPVTIESLNEVIAEYERISAEVETLRADAVENSYVPGDVELTPDGEVTAIDVQQIVNWVLDGMTWQELYEESPRRAYAADLNGNKTLDITDVAMDISLVYGEDPTTRRMARFAAPATDQAESMNIELVSEENGVRRFAINLNNATEMIAGQIDLKLPAGMYLSEVSAGERAESHSLETREHGSDTVRVVLYSMENAAFSGNNGAVIYVDVIGKGTLKAENVKFTDTFFNTHEMRGTDSSFISDVWDSAKEMGNRFYNAAGVMFNKMQNGINIFRGKDGKVKKQYNRNNK